MALLLAASLLGLSVGLRTFTGPAVLWLVRHGGIWAHTLGVLALVEYALDLHPRAGARTQPLGLAARIISAAFCGWAVTFGTNLVYAGVVVAALAALLGAYGGLAVRLKSASMLGRVPAALVEDVIAIAIAVIAIRV
jgi:uncharacterized membrane protein